MNLVQRLEIRSQYCSDGERHFDTEGVKLLRDFWVVGSIDITAQPSYVSVVGGQIDNDGVGNLSLSLLLTSSMLPFCGAYNELHFISWDH